MEQYRQAQGFAPYATAPLYQPSAVYQPQVPTTGTFLGLSPQNAQFWKGVALGAAVTLLLTNDSVQKGLVKTVARMTAAAQSGIEEMKEKFEDAKAEAMAEAEEQ